MPNTSKHTLLRGEALLLAILATVNHIKWVSTDTLESHLIEPSMAHAIARSGVYEGKFRGKRVYSMREIDTRPKPQLDPEFWRDRAVIRWARPANKETVDLWDKIFKNASLRRAGVRV